MSDIKEGDWVITRDIGHNCSIALNNHSDTFCFPEMVITTPVRVFPEVSAYKGWVVFEKSNFAFIYHPDWLRKVNQDGSPIEWSWLTELGWGG